LSQIKKPTHQLNLRSGGVAFAAHYPENEIGEFCWLGNHQGETHSWREDGRWSADRDAHPFDILSSTALKE
jgi:hypothetical protein